MMSEMNLFKLDVQDFKLERFQLHCRFIKMLQVLGNVRIFSTYQLGFREADPLHCGEALIGIEQVRRACWISYGAINVFSQAYMS